MQPEQEANSLHSGVCLHRLDQRGGCPFLCSHAGGWPLPLPCQRSHPEPLHILSLAENKHQLRTQHGAQALSVIKGIVLRWSHVVLSRGHGGAEPGGCVLWPWASACVLGRAPTTCSEAGQGPGEPKVGRDSTRHSQIGAEPWPSPSQRVQGFTGDLMGEWLKSGLVVPGGL